MISIGGVIVIVLYSIVALVCFKFMGGRVVIFRLAIIVKRVVIGVGDW